MSAISFKRITELSLKTVVEVILTLDQIANPVQLKLCQNIEATLSDVLATGNLAAATAGHFSFKKVRGGANPKAGWYILCSQQGNLVVVMHEKG